MRLKISTGGWAQDYLELLTDVATEVTDDYQTSTACVPTC